MPNTNPTRYWSLAQAEGSREAHIYIFGDITSWPWLDSDVSSYRLTTQINQIDADEIHVHINSLGGEVQEALAILNNLMQHKAKITTYVDGFACSAASIVLMAGERRIAAKCSNILIHPASSMIHGNAAAMRAEADNLDVITEQSVTAYVSRSGKSREEIVSLMAEERFISPEEALNWGLVTEIQDLFEGDRPTQSVRELIARKLASGDGTPKQKTVKTFLDAMRPR